MLAVLFYLRCMVKMAYPLKIQIFSYGMMLCFMMSSLSYFIDGSYGFPLYVGSTLLLSSFASITECCGLSSIKYLSEEIMSWWSAGTGLSEMIGTLIFLFIFRMFKASQACMYLLFSPVFLLLAYSFHKYWGMLMQDIKEVCSDNSSAKISFPQIDHTIMQFFKARHTIALLAYTHSPFYIFLHIFSRQ